MSENGAMSPGWWQLWQFVWKIRTTSLLNVGGVACPARQTDNRSKTARKPSQRMAIIFAQVAGFCYRRLYANDRTGSQSGNAGHGGHQPDFQRRGLRQAEF